MYRIYFRTKSLYKEFFSIVEDTKNVDGISPVRQALENYPKGSSQTHRKIEKKGKYWCYDLTQGDRITYSVYDDKHAVFIQHIGNHNEYIRFLKK